MPASNGTASGGLRAGGTIELVSRETVSPPPRSSDHNRRRAEMKAIAVTSAIVGLTLAGCAMEDRAPPEPWPDTVRVEADMRDPAGRLMARSTASQVGDGIRVRVEAAGLAPGTYAAHVHAVGRCDPPGFDSAGPHWNPTNREHGSNNPRGMHKGDLPNLIVGANGEGSFEYSIPQARLAGGPMAMLDADGAAVVIHANPDDYRTDPSGNSGARIACGVYR
jgi:superoxide dismutase, Cu-Zn family